MKLYNVSFDLRMTNDLLIPSIPFTTGDGEDKITKRICLTDSVANCMQAISTEYRHIAVGSKFLLKTVEIKPDQYLIGPQQLVNWRKVPDALENKEYWYLKPVFCESVQKCEITYFNHEMDLAWTCISVEQCREIVRKYTGLEFNRCKTSKGLYDAFCKWAHERSYWSMLDNVWDDLAMLPWAQKTRIYNLKYKIL